MSRPEAAVRALLDDLQRVVAGVCTLAECERVNAMFAPEIRRLVGRLCDAVDIGAGLPVDDLAVESAPLQRLDRFAAGCASPDEINVLQTQVAAWRRAGGAVSLERCLHAQPLSASWRNAQRDAWLRRAATLLAEERPGLSVAEALHVAWSKFLALGGPWSRWRDDADPPPDATPLSAALFHASRWHRSSVEGALTARRLRSVLSEISRDGDFRE